MSDTTLVSRTSFVATGAGTGYSIGDYIDHVLVIDVTGGTVVAKFWENLTTEAKLASAPIIGNLTATGAGGSSAGLPTSLGQKAAAASTSVVLSSDGPFATNFGTTNDAAWDGSAGSASHMAIAKALWTKLGAIVIAAGSAVIGKVGLQVAGVDVSTTNTIPVQENSIAGQVTITPSDSVTVAVGRQFAIIATVAGNVKIKFSDGTLFTFPVGVGFTLLPWKVQQVFITLTTATATFYNLS